MYGQRSNRPIVEDSRVRRISTSIHSSKPVDPIDQDRIVQIIEAMNTDCVSRLETQRFEASGYLADCFSALICGPEFGSVFDVDV